MRSTERVAPVRRRRAIAGAVLLFGLATPLGAQTHWLPSLRLDNDAYDFWMRPGQRPDAEYTNGVRVSLSTGSAPLWGQRFAPRRHDCANRVAESAPCLATTVTLGQDLYTPRLDRTPYVNDWQDERPFFAWLFLGMEARIVGARTLRTVGLTAGVTGPPAGGELAQRTAHSINRRYTRTVTGWETQIPFEPGVMASLRESWLSVRRGDGTGPGFDLSPSVGASLGNIRTGADAGATARLGWNLSHPWDPRSGSSPPLVEAWIALGGRAQYVARNISLDGTTFHPDRRVDRVPGVLQYEFGAGLRLSRLVLTYRAVTTSREYATGPVHHAWGSMTAGLAFP